MERATPHDPNILAQINQKKKNLNSKNITVIIIQAPVPVLVLVKEFDETSESEDA